MENEIVTIAKFLKLEREKQALTLEQVSEDTKIKIRLLKDIENNNFANLGGTGYAKAMLMNYARYLKIDEKKTSELLNQTFKIKQTYLRHDKSIQPKKIILPANFFAFVALVVVVIVLTFFIVFLFKSGTLTWPPFQNEKSKVETKKVQIKVKEKTKLSKLEQIKQQKKETPTQKSTIDKKALKDTTDYLNKLLFENKKNPLNYDD